MGSGRRWFVLMTQKMISGGIYETMNGDRVICAGKSKANGLNIIAWPGTRDFDYVDDSGRYSNGAQFIKPESIARLAELAKARA